MTTLTDAGQGMDVAIGGLGFKVAISKDQPYERATAQFRKEQFDSTPTVGDQSLTGMWTRGQLTFHKGAGVTYYEVSDGDSVLNRYDDCEDVEVFTPGRVTLLPSRTDMALAATDVVPAPLSAGGGVYALTDTGVYYTAGSGSTATATSNAAVPTAITSSGSLFYVANGAYLERQYLASDARTNHVTNPSFETGTAGWTITGGTGVQSSVRAKYGTYSVRVTPSGGGNGTASCTLTGLSIGQTYAVKAWVYVSSTAAVSLAVDATTVATSVLSNTFEPLAGTFVATATTHTLKSFGVDTGFGYPSTYHLDAVLFTESPYTADYFDGSQPGCAWAGAANASKSNFQSPAAGASTVRITLSGGATWTGVWWAKGRLWAVDSGGYWYALADSVVTVTNADAFWASGLTGVQWSLTEGTGPVYISDGHDIYAVTVGTDGVVPVISTPTTAARVPLGEEIATISYYLGYIVLPTTRGVRVALTQDNEILLGPLVVEGDFSASNRVGVYDTKAYVVGRPDGRGGDSVLCVIDLGQTVSDLVPAWSPLSTVSDLASTASGAAVDATGRTYAWAAESLLMTSPDELAAEGYLTTGYHRFGTLEPKSFRNVLVRVGGDGGEVQVSRIDSDGTETDIGDPITAPNSVDISLGMTTPAEMVGLKFTMARDADDPTKGPELLGYQIRALPAPTRQRMIRVPLLLMDNERGGNGAPTTGYDGSAWDRLDALETMEASGGVHDWQDFRTGETGTVFIESVEHRGTTSPSSMDDGFGGIVWLTLRKID